MQYSKCSFSYIQYIKSLKIIFKKKNYTLYIQKSYINIPVPVKTLPSILPATLERILPRILYHIHKLEMKVSKWEPIFYLYSKKSSKKIYIYNCDWTLFPFGKISKSWHLDWATSARLCYYSFFLFLFFTCVKMRPNISVIDHSLKTSNKVGPWGP